MVLWTYSCLVVARHIDAKEVFQLVKSDPYRVFGKDLVGETCELKR